MVHKDMPIKSPVIGKILRTTFIIGIALLPGLFASGQVKFTTNVSSQDLGKSDYLQVEFVVENAKQIDDLTPPNFPGFHIAQGPIQSSGMSIVNGNMSQYKALSFVLEPTKTGKFTIGGASATVDGKHMQSNAVTVNVHPGGSGTANSNSQQGGNPNNPFGNNPFGSSPFFQPNMPDPFSPDGGDVDRDVVIKPGENVKEKIKKGLFVRLQVSKNTCYVGEPIVATYKLYTRVNSESRITKQPSLNGFSVYDMIDPSQDAVSVEKLNGKNYTVHTIRKTQLIPLQSGTIDLDPVEVANTVHFVKASGNSGRGHGGNSIRDLIDQMMDEGGYGSEVDENVTLDTKPLPITVKPLPEESKPAGFNGAVGSFSIEASLSNKSVTADDEATLHVVVKGKGNLPVIAAPAVNWPSGIQAFDPTAKEDVNKTVAPMSGSKSFDYVFTPRTAGHYTIPAINFPYFDPASQSYKTAGTQALDIQVTPAAKSHNKTPDLYTARTTARPGLIGLARNYGAWIGVFLLLSGTAVYFWRQNQRLRKASLAGSTAAVAVTPVQKEKTNDGIPSIVKPVAERTNAPVRPDRPPAAPAGPVIPATTFVSTAPAADPLAEAKQFFENEDSKGFYREVNRAIWKAMGRKLDLPASELNKSNSLHQLQLRGWNDTALMTLENLLNECEMNLYTPAYDRWNMQQLLRQAEWVLDRLA
ncbi:MAG TPA: BatD family protein [Puia sp.]|nr:BatD family protein [Puia sp.]